MVLIFWNIQWLHVQVGRGSRASLFKGLFCRKKKIKGWAYRSLTNWFFVYEDKGRLFFRTPNFSVPIENKYSVSNNRSNDGKRVFSIKSNGKIIFNYIYAAISRNYYARNDLSYDNIDEEHEDFFLWVKILWSDKAMQNSLIKQWKD